MFWLIVSYIHSKNKCLVVVYYGRVQLVLSASTLSSWSHSSCVPSLNSHVGTHLSLLQRANSFVHSTYVIFEKLSPNIAFCFWQCWQVTSPYMIAHWSVKHWAKVSRFFVGVCWAHPAKNIAANIPMRAIFFILLYIRGKIRHKNLFQIFDVVSIYRNHFIKFYR